MADLDQDIAAYEKLQTDLESRHVGKWVLVHNEVLVSLYDSFEAAADEAVKRFGRGPYLIRQIGAPPMTLPASVLYHRRRDGHTGTATISSEEIPVREMQSGHWRLTVGRLGGEFGPGSSREATH